MQYNTKPTFNVPNAKIPQYQTSVPVIGNGYALGLMSDPASTSNKYGMIWTPGNTGIPRLSLAGENATKLPYLNLSSAVGAKTDMAVGVINVPDKSGLISDFSQTQPFTAIIKY